MSETYDLIVVGSGIAGLTAAYKAKKRGLKTLVLESASEIGGLIKSKVYKEGSEETLYELGPNTFLSSAENLNNLIKELGLENELLSLGFKDSKRFIYFKDGLHEVPVNPFKLLFSPILSPLGKLRVLLEPFCKKKNDKEESVAEFIERKFGKEVLDRLVSTFLQGVWAADEKKLSAKSALSKLVNLEEDYGSILLGLMKSPRKKKRVLKIHSFKKGMQVLVDSLANSIGFENIKTEELIKDIKYDGSYEIELEDSVIKSKALILATPAYKASELSLNLSRDLSEPLSGINYSPIALSFMKLERNSLKKDHEGFGLLIANNTLKKPFKTMGTIWSSELFKERKLTDSYIFASYLFGAKGDVEKNFEEIAIEEQKAILGPGAKIEPLNSMLLERAIPQYNLGHSDLIQKLNIAKEKFPGLGFVGNYLSGISLEDTISHSIRVSAKI